MAELVTHELLEGPPAAFHGKTFDAKSLVLAIASTILLLASLALLGALDRGQADPLQTIALFEIPAAEQSQTPLPPEVIDKPVEKPVEVGKSLPSAPAPAPAFAPLKGASDLAIVPIPAIELSPVIVPKVAFSGSAAVLAEGSGSRISGNVAPAGTGTGKGRGGNGTGGTGSGGDGTGDGGRGKLTARWAPEMRLSALNAYFPAAARETRRGGSAVVKCFALKSHRMRDCSLVGEYPDGLGFGAAALASEPVLRVQILDQKGKRVYNTWVLFNAEFRHPDTGKPAPTP